MRLISMLLILIMFCGGCINDKVDDVIGVTLPDQKPNPCEKTYENPIAISAEVKGE